MSVRCHQFLSPIFATAASLSLSACIVPYHYTGAPAVAGQVVNQTTHQPITGAIVSMTDLTNDSVHTQTDEEGRFRLPTVRHWLLVPVPSDGFRTPEGTLHIDAVHYRSYTEQVDFETSRRRGDLQRLHIALAPGV